MIEKYLKTFLEPINLSYKEYLVKHEDFQALHLEVLIH